MFQRILDQQLQRHRQYVKPVGVVDFNLQCDAVAVAQLLQVKIVVHKSQFAAERYQLAVAVIENIAVGRREFADKLIGQIDILLDDGGECVEAVEEKMGVHLVFQRFVLVAQFLFA